MVAEKSTVCRSGGALARMVLMSSMKPMSSIRSASSSITILIASSFSVPRSR